MPTLGRWTCTERRQAGGDCFSDDNCQPDLYCDNPSLSVRGDTCKPHEPDGTACELPTECASVFCHEGRCAAPDAQLAYCLGEES
jgi:hypothetical protein